MDRDQNDSGIVQYLYEILGEVVILPIPKGEKGPKFNGWNNTTYEDTQTDTYRGWLSTAVERGGNLGILLGPNSGGLVAIDFDDDDEVELFYEMYPELKDTMKSRGRHYQLWFVMDGEYPMERIILKKVAGKPTVEFRGGGGLQSVVWGVHPQGMRYSVTGTPIHTSYAALSDWISVMQGYASDGDPRKHDYSKLAKFKGLDIHDLDLLELLQEAEIYPKQVDKGTYAIQCPWVGEHTTKSGLRDAALWQYPIGSRFPAFRCLHAHCVDRWLLDLLDWLEDAYPGIVARHCKPRRRGKSLDQCIVMHERLKEEPELPRQIVDGLLYEKTKMMVSGPPKMRKSWLAIDLALSLVLGEQWLGFDTCQTRVLYLNMEIPGVFLDWRLYMLEEARRVDEIPEGSFTILNLRGSNILDQDWNELARFCERNGPYGVIFIDPIYKVFGEREENSAKDMAALLRNVDMVSEASGAAMIEIHHFAKGLAFDKEVGDRASGSGVFFRDPDLFVTLYYANQAKEDNEARLDIKTRLFPVVQPMGLRWAGFRWQRDDGININSKVQEETISREKQLLELLMEQPNGMTHGEWKQAAMIRYNISSAAFGRIIQSKTIQARITQKGKLYYVKRV